ncbi:MAG: KUP/HAK/KT family potassium transporter, partial [Bdellovibrionales bacterium]|nr:KUP/HAK/KT family potassium transporter [Bdellovibrionales bacterium]
LFGDGMITPAISVLSAVEGLNVATPFFAPYVIPATIAILISLFVVQKYGTAKIGAFFGPIMLVWFFVLGAIGVYWILQNPSVLGALDPRHAADFFLVNRWTGFFVLGSVFLVVTGGEALYADMGHFGRDPIRIAWFTLVLPGLLLNYLGQGALLLADPTAIDNPFFKMTPAWGLYPMVVLATAATVIASQALISGTYSLTRQAVQLGYLPRIQIVHTSKDEIGQIYVPLVNWMLLAATVWLVLQFRTSSNLAAAYGLAVTATMVTTTILAYFVARRIWGWSRVRGIAVVSVFLVVDLAFFAGNVVKIPQGGWFPLVIGAAMYFLMSTWQQGRAILAVRMRQLTQPISQFVERIRVKPLTKVPGVAVFMTSDPEGAPAALLHNVKHNKILHEKVVILTIQTQDVPYVFPDKRVELVEKNPGLWRVIAYYGFMQTPNIYEILTAARAKGLELIFSEITFFLGRETVLPSDRPGMSLWREGVFALMSRNAQRATAFFQIPPDQVIEVGIQVEI